MTTNINEHIANDGWRSVQTCYSIIPSYSVHILMFSTTGNRPVTKRNLCHPSHVTRIKYGGNITVEYGKLPFSVGKLGRNRIQVGLPVLDTYIFCHFEH